MTDGLLIEALLQVPDLQLEDIHPYSKVGDFGAEWLLVLGGNYGIELVFDSTQSLLDTNEGAQNVSVLCFEGIQSSFHPAEPLFNPAFLHVSKVRIWACKIFS